MYPTPNLEDWYEREGYRDEDFKGNDKGTWTLLSAIDIPKGDKLVSEGMVLYINRNTKKTTGYYFITEIFEEEVGVDSKSKRYPVKMEKNKITATKKINDPKLKEKIEQFKFFSQYGNFTDLNKYEKKDIVYNSNAPLYRAEYQLTNENQNVKKLRKYFNIPDKKAPILELKGRGDLKGSSIGSKELQFKFKKDGDLLSFSDSIDYIPSEEDWKWRKIIEWIWMI